MTPLSPTEMGRWTQALQARIDASIGAACVYTSYANGVPASEPGFIALAAFMSPLLPRIPSPCQPDDVVFRLMTGVLDTQLRWPRRLVRVSGSRISGQVPGDEATMAWSITLLPPYGVYPAGIAVDVVCLDVDNRVYLPQGQLPRRPLVVDCTPVSEAEAAQLREVPWRWWFSTDGRIRRALAEGHVWVGQLAAAWGLEAPPQVHPVAQGPRTRESWTATEGPGASWEARTPTSVPAWVAAEARYAGGAFRELQLIVTSVGWPARADDGDWVSDLPATLSPSEVEAVESVRAKRSLYEGLVG